MDVLMPQLGETVAEGKITKWFKALGDKVAPGDNLFEVETDKVTVEVPAISSGVLTAINAEVGSVTPVGTVVAIVSGEGETTARPDRAPSKPGGNRPALRPAPSQPEFVTASRAALDPFREVDTPRRNFGPAKLSSGILVTPLARRLADGASIDLTLLSGTGPRGRIVGKDVEQAIVSRAPSPGLPGDEGLGALADLYHRRPHRVVAVDGMRRTVAARLTRSKATIPHFYLTAHIDAGRLSRVRAEINEGAPKNTDGVPAYRLSINDFLVKALALALRDVPAANAIWSGDGILEFEHSDVAVAVAVPGGLITPVVADAETKSIATIAAEVKDLSRRAKARALKPEEYQGGTTTISNLGMHGIEAFSAIINPPQATILAIGAAHRHPVETGEGGVAFIDRMTATLSCDHRVVDGVLGAELLTQFRTFVENPLRMLV